MDAECETGVPTRARVNTRPASSTTAAAPATWRRSLPGARFFGGDLDAVPRHCITQGLGTILEARHLVLVATGAVKAEAVHQLVEGAVSARWPATVLQLHPRVSEFIDEAAAARLELADYYRFVQRHKPQTAPSQRLSGTSPV